MKQLSKLFFAAGAIALAACNNIDETVDMNGEYSVTAELESLIPVNIQTRIAATDKGDGHFGFSWQGNDKIAMYGKSTNADGWGFFKLAGDGGDAAGVFTGIFKLANETTYYSFYPTTGFSPDTDEAAIPVDYTDQSQTENANLSHLHNYIYYAAATAEGRFKFKHVGALVRIQIADEHADKCTSIEFSTNGKFVKKGTINLTETTTSSAPKITPTETSTTFSVGYHQTQTSTDGTITVYAMIAPTDLSNKSLQVTTKHSISTYDKTFNLEPTNIEAGKAYKFVKDTNSIPYLTFYSDEKQTFEMTKAVETLEYSVNDGDWAELGTNVITFGGTEGNLRLRGKSSYGTAEHFGSNLYSRIIFARYSTEKPVSCTGDIRTIVDYENYNSVDCSNARFCNLFQYCTKLTNAPMLPSKNLATYCYYGMFSNCISLEETPKLPATNLSDYCYCKMFYECSSLTYAPRIEATSLASHCYEYMFKNCFKLTDVQEILPATTLANYCYNGMFSSCWKLAKAPNLPANTLKENCYEGMFSGCSSLQNTPSISATTLANACYRNMFMNCTSLKSTPNLPITTLADNCYQGMFSGCSSLIIAPEILPATNLTKYCYKQMFYLCRSLEKAPVLPATNLAYYCYNLMFNGCTSLTSAPELPANNLVDGCYQEMFQYCDNITSVKMLATDISATNCLNNWMNGVSETGTFTKNSDATWSNSGVVPSGWTVRQKNPMHNGHEYVDLGLKDSEGRTIYWATCNVGAETPEDFGLYFAWGETVGYTNDVSDGHSFDWENYSLSEGSIYTIKKYCASSYYGVIDNKKILNPEDDAARNNWGGNWRMPTLEEQYQLVTSCTWEWSSIKKGYTVTGKNGISFFLPAAGSRYESYSNTTGGYSGGYWSSSLYTTNSDQAYMLSFSQGIQNINRVFDYRASGHSVRAVYVPEE